jgi:hypothetical protein
MRSTPLLRRLYLLNAAVLITHEIDSAYWREWELLGIPGGIQVFLGLNLLLVALVLYGQQGLAFGRASGLVASWVLVAGGFFAVLVHAFFLLQGSKAFLNLASLALLTATCALSAYQAVALIRAKAAPE